jgi:hypothetical protein
MLTGRCILITALSLLAGCASQWTMDHLAQTSAEHAAIVQACQQGDNAACDAIPEVAARLQTIQQQDAEQQHDVSEIVVGIALLPLVVLGAAYGKGGWHGPHWHQHHWW